MSFFKRKPTAQEIFNAVIRGHNEMPGATPKACPCFKPSKEFAYMMK